MRRIETKETLCDDMRDREKRNRSRYDVKRDERKKIEKNEKNPLFTQ
jgi:hypothetical protein